VLQVHDLVSVKPNSRHPYRDAVGGFISSIAQDSGALEVCILDADGGLVDTVEVHSAAVAPNSDERLRIAFEKYQRMVDDIAFECDERARKYRLTQAALAKRYKISQDEVYAIYKGMLDYENYHDTHIQRLI